MHERLRRLIPTREQIQNNRWLRWLGPYFHHPRLWHWSRRGVATGVAVGVFFGFLIPIGQIPFSAAAAVILRANVTAAAARTLMWHRLRALGLPLLVGLAMAATLFGLASYAFISLVWYLRVMRKRRKGRSR